MADSEGDRTKRLAIVAGSVGATALIGALALALGHWGFEQRQRGMHVTRLERLVGKAPAVEQVHAGLREEGARYLGSAESPEALERLSALWTQDGATASRWEREWSEARAYRNGPFVYVVYFDGSGTLVDFGLHAVREPPG